MSESIYERYKAALRQGHLAALRGQLEVAIDAYREAAAIVPERALPHASIGTVELRRGRPAEALEAFEAALERSPDDEAALRGRAEALAALDRRAAAAETLDRLASLLEADGRVVEACEVVARALELAESRPRRQQMALLTDRVRASPLGAAAETALARALGVLGEAAPFGPPPVATSDGGASPAPAAPTTEATALDAEGAGRSGEGAPPTGAASATDKEGARAASLGLEGMPAGPAPTPNGAGAALGDAEAGTAVAADEGGGAATAETPRGPTVEAAVPSDGGAAARRDVRPAPLPAHAAVRLALEAEEALEAGDRETAIGRFLEAAAAHAAGGRTTAALDACARIVAAYPDALEAQEALVHLYLELGWRSLAIEKVRLLDRLTAFGDDPLLRARVLLLRRELLGEAVSGTESS